jgi:hypothetical protein
MNYSRLTAAAALALGLTFPPVTGAQNSPAQRPDDAGLKHPPTAQMDAATPPSKSTRKPDSAKHPPTSAMDRAAPDEKSPGTTQDPAASTDTQQKTPPAKPRTGTSG